MIITNISHLNSVPHLKSILQKVTSIDLINLPSGEHLLEGKTLFLNRISSMSRTVAESKSEIHRDYIDIHLLLSGKETIGYSEKPATKKFMDCSPFHNDCELIDELVGEQFLTLNANQFAIFYPSIWHRPMLNLEKTELIEKVVIKIHKDYV